MVDLKSKPLRRCIPGTSYFIEITPTHISLRVTGSRRPGVSRSLIELIDHLAVPGNAPAKFHGDPKAYLDWVARKRNKS
jgi:hypothetical protein